jgi:single-stranded-DNA-specific exonuclease
VSILDSLKERKIEVENWKKRESKLTRMEGNMIKYYANQLSLDPFVIELLFQRGCRDFFDMNRFLSCDPSYLLGPFYLTDMDMAVKRIYQAIERDEHISIFGDYDVDGITSTSILYKGLKILGAKVDFRLPKRLEGYGLSVEAVNRFSAQGTALIVTVDNGSSAHDAIKRAKQIGIDVIVTDHHEILHGNPPSLVFINPRRSDERSPFKSLAGCGVALKLVHALLLKRGLWEKYLWDFVELAALGTIADVMPLKEDNRVIVQLGLEKMNRDPSKSIKIIKRLLGITNVNSQTIGFSFGPILNSLGRLCDPNFAVHLFTSNTNEQIMEDCWNKLIRLNQLRKKMVSDQYKQAELMIHLYELYNQKVIIVVGPFTDGLIGILAARIAEKYKKPTIVFTENGKGSARSVNGSSFSIANAIERCAEHLISFGGHQAAAGLTVYMDRYHHFCKQIQKNSVLEPSISVQHIYETEFSILDFPKDLSNDLLQLEPFGEGNPMPLFHSKRMQINRVSHFGLEEEHAKFHIGSKQALLFFKGNDIKKLTNQNNLGIQCLYSPSLNSNRDFIIKDYFTF